MSKWRKAFGLGDKKVEQSLTQLSSIDQADLNLLVEPSAEQPMVGHAQQHSALTRLAKETNTDLVEVGATVDRNTADIDDISEFLGAVYFEVSLGKERWTFDTQAVPAEGNFTAFSYLFDEYNTEFWINKIPAGYEETGFETARPGDKMQIEGQADKTDFGDYVITSILLDNDNVWQVQGDFVEGNGRLTAGRNYEIEIIHVSQQFEKKRKDGSPQIASTDYVDAGDELKLDKTGGSIIGQLSVSDDIFLNGGNGKQNINAKAGYAGKLKYDGTEKLSWGGNEVVVKNSDLSMDYNRIKKVALPVEDTDAASKKYVDSILANDGVGGELEFVLPKFYPSGKRNYKTTPSVSSDSGSSPWFVTAASHTNGTGNAWPGNANAIHLYYDADQHDKVATGAGTILIFDKDDNKIMMHAVVTGTPLKQKMSGKDCWSFEIVLIEALGRQWDYTSEYEMTLSGVFWAA